MLDALHSVVCTKDAEELARHNALIVALTALRDNTAAAIIASNAKIDAATTLIDTDQAGIDAANIFIAANRTAIDAIIAGVAANTASAAANTASAAANASSTATNAALLATVEALAGAVRTDVDALGTRTTAVELSLASLSDADTALGARIQTIEERPQASTDNTAQLAIDAVQDGRLDNIENDTSAVCLVLKGFKDALDALPTARTDFACTHGITANAVPDMALTMPTDSLT